VTYQREEMRGQGIRCTMEMKMYILGEVENYVILSGSLVTMTKKLPDILCSRLTPPVDEIIRDHQCGYNGSTINQSFCVCQILEKK
jgi:hypothetical protein